MARLNLNFHQVTGRREPTKQEIDQIEGLALSIESISKAMIRYTCDTTTIEEANEAITACMGVFRVFELLIAPVIDCLANYAGDEAAPEPTEGA